MNVTIRFGHIDDATRITPIDKSIKVNVLNWKLHNQEIIVAEPQQWHRHVGFKECGIIHAINEGNIGEIFFVKTIDAQRNG